ncbi:MAG: hypothetical protein QM692_10490 [Thermomicrobiales bacterium]
MTLNGWPFPIIGSDAEFKRTGNDWVGEDVGWQFGPSLWRLYRSGQFVTLLGMWRDWYERAPSDFSGDEVQNWLPLWDTIRQVTAFYEFAARFSLTEAGDSAMNVSIKLGNIQGRVLRQDNPRKTPLRNYRFSAPSFSWPRPGANTVARDELVGRPRELAAEGLAELFRQFDFNAGPQAIRGWQEELDSP